LDYFRQSLANMGKFDFTNIFIDENNLFVNIAEKYFGIARSDWKFGLICNKKLYPHDINRIAEEFSSKLRIKLKFYHTTSTTVTNFAYNIYINSTLLNLIFNKVLKILRKEIINYGIFEDFCKGFIMKDLLGDGNININKDLTSMDIVLSEEEQQSQKDIKNILAKFNINSNIYLNKLDISTKFDSCMWFLENDLFIGHVNNRNKFLKYISHNFFYKY